MKRLPILPTLVVLLACAAMVALGFWQLQRRTWKLGLLAQYGANLNLPAVDFPHDPHGHDELLFRRSQAECLRPLGWERQAGHAANGATGWLVIARCAGTTAPFRVGLGVTPNPTFVPNWPGGLVRGTITHAPSHRSLLAGAFDKAPEELMLIADDAPAGLSPSARPNPSSVPNNHLAYAVQWFIFAAVAAVIYLLALRRRNRVTA